MGVDCRSGSAVGGFESWDGTSAPVEFADSSNTRCVNTKTLKTVVSNPHKLLREHYRRSATNGEGTYRYAVKFLKEEVRTSPQQYAIATADLVVEGMFLASLSHP